MKCKFEQCILKLFSYASQVKKGRLKEVKLDDTSENGRIWAKLDSHLPQNGQYSGGLLSQSEGFFYWKWTVWIEQIVKVDGLNQTNYESERSESN